VNRFVLSLVLLLAPLFDPSSVASQGVTVYNIVAEEYRIGNFRIHPPRGDGWRQIGDSHPVLRMVYAESLDDGSANKTILTRADIVAQAFAVSNPDVIPNGLRLTLNGQTQMMEQRGDSLVGYSRIEKIETGVETHKYTLKIKLGETKIRSETYFVSLAPDRSEYLVIKVTIDEEDSEQLPFYNEFLDSFKTLSFPQAQSAEPAASLDDAATDPQPESVPETAEPKSAQ